MLLTEFDIIYVTQKAVKDQSIADLLMNHIVDDYQSMNISFLDEAVLFAIGKEQ